MSKTANPTEGDQQEVRAVVDRPADAGGTVYLLHFHAPFAHARHYLGATGLPLEERLAAHRGEVLHEGDRRYGTAAKLLVAVQAAGGGWDLADVWETATRKEAFELERRLKKQGSRARLCSICNPGNARGVGGRWPGRRVDGRG